jgi:anthranilate synthase/indole-3-glycerol phosphate synthase/phosphoribosylanthranilate isomerase
VSEPTILDRIVEQRRKDVAEAKLRVPEAALRERIAAAPVACGFVARLRASAPMALIAEIKRASPSKGDIAPGIDAAKQGARYAEAGAAGISVLTEPTWFKGTLEDMLGVRMAIEGMESRPAVLRKDFIVDEYQVLEARVFGADAVLLIVASLSDEEIVRLMGFARELGMDALVEVNNGEEMRRAVAAGAGLIGINNRDLRSFDVDLGTTDRLAVLAPEGTLLAALSGIATREDVERFAAVGAGAVLVGEALMVAGEAGEKVRELLGESSEARVPSSEGVG